MLWKVQVCGASVLRKDSGPVLHIGSGRGGFTHYPKFNASYQLLTCLDTQPYRGCLPQLSTDFGCHSGDCPGQCGIAQGGGWWHKTSCPAWTQDLLQKWSLTGFEAFLFTTEKSEGALAGWNCSFAKLASILPDLPGGGIEAVIISVNTLCSCPAPVTALIFHAPWRQGVPQCPPHTIWKPEISLLLSLLQLGTFVRPLQIPTFWTYCQMLVGGWDSLCWSQRGNTVSQYNDNNYSSN